MNYVKTIFASLVISVPLAIIAISGCAKHDSAASCTDGVKNQNETGIDCGGTCAACVPTCADSIQNQGEDRVDCGGPCTPCLDVNGIWEVYKYMLNSSDKTIQFHNQYPNYTITFTNDGKFTEFNSSGGNTTGNYSLLFPASDNDKLRLDNTFNTFVLDSVGDTTFVPHTRVRLYTIFIPSHDTLQLFDDTSQMYFNRKI
jgi:hypothetical protein